jgi:hypothetical protein
VGYRGIVKGQVIVLDEGVTLKEGTPVEVIPIQEPPKGRPTALLEVWGSDVPDEGWDAVERAISELRSPTPDNFASICLSCVLMDHDM